jgi:hypothetical protein
MDFYPPRYKVTVGTLPISVAKMTKMIPDPATLPPFMQKSKAYFIFVSFTGIE